MGFGLAPHHTLRVNFKKVVRGGRFPINRLKMNTKINMKEFFQKNKKELI